MKGFDVLEIKWDDWSHWWLGLFEIETLEHSYHLFFIERRGGRNL